MKFLLVFLVLLASADAQTIALKNGQEIAAQSLRRSGATVFARITVAGGGSGEIGHPVAAIERIDFPRPDGLNEAVRLHASGKIDEALAAIDPVISAAEPFRDIAGSWWTPAVVEKIRMFLDVSRTTEAETLLGRIPRDAPIDADALDLLRADLLLKKKNFSDAAALYSTLLSRTHDDAIAARAWIGTGAIHLAGQDAEAALLAFLRVPVLFGSETTVQPAALLGSARAATALGDQTEAAEAVEQLVTVHSASAEAAEARREFPTLIPSKESTP